MITPKPYSIEGCVFCDKLTYGKAYRGSVREYRTRDGRTIPWVDYSSNIRLVRTMDFLDENGEVLRGGEITHGQRVHDAVSNSDNLISFTVVSTGLKRYVLIKVSDNKTLLLRKLRASKDISDEEIANHIVEGSDLNNLEELLEPLITHLPPQRVEQVINKIARNPKIARLVKERSKFICEICGREPFIQRSGRLYAEADHIRPLGGGTGGLDTPENIRCICAQCHAIVTYGSDDVIRELLSSTKWQS